MCILPRENFRSIVKLSPFSCREITALVRDTVKKCPKIKFCWKNCLECSITGVRVCKSSGEVVGEWLGALFNLSTRQFSSLSQALNSSDSPIHFLTSPPPLLQWSNPICNMQNTSDQKTLNMRLGLATSIEKYI